MNLAEHLEFVQARLSSGNFRAALGAMADDTLLSFVYEANLQAMAVLFEDAMPKSVRKDRRKMDRIRSMTTHIYQNVHPKVAQWGHEAHAEGLRAFGMERDHNAPAKMKVRAHHQAHQAHLVAAHHLSKAGHADAAGLHRHAAVYHKDRRSSLSRQHGVEEMPFESNEKPQTVRDWRHSRLGEGAESADQSNQDDGAGGEGAPPRKKSRVKAALGNPDMSMAFPKTESIENWITDLDEGEYHPDVKQASMLAANSTKLAQQPNATADHHETAARLHFIASGVAKAHGHKDLAAKHDTFVQKHRESAKQARLAS